MWSTVSSTKYCYEPEQCYVHRIKKKSLTSFSPCPYGLNGWDRSPLLSLALIWLSLFLSSARSHFRQLFCCPHCCNNNNMHDGSDCLSHQRALKGKARQGKPKGSLLSYNNWDPPAGSQFLAGPWFTDGRTDRRPVPLIRGRPCLPACNRGPWIWTGPNQQKLKSTKTNILKKERKKE